MNAIHSLQRNMIFSGLALALAGCGSGSDSAGAGHRDMTSSNATANASLLAMSEQDMINEVSSSLQACSYDGAAVRVDSSAMASSQTGAGASVVAEIMRYTGLPQNFEVMPHPDVPNAAAVILIGADQLPHRVIAYNEAFMADVLKATQGNNWAPISIMAHEIGHHLSGHTLQPGGSQPPSELEADKFSGFMLYKMGAVLTDAEKAMNTLVPETDGPTHPGRSKRVRAIEDGWKQACAQQSGDCSGLIAATPTLVPAGSTSAASTNAAEKLQTASISTPTNQSTLAGNLAPSNATSIAGNPGIDVMPEPDQNAVPSKFGKFVIDELGVLDPTTRSQFEKQMFNLADQHQVEIVTIVADSLHGMSADDYAYAMMRQLRVGKLDVGNGAVLVVAPTEQQVGVAMGPAVMLEMSQYVALEKDRLKGFVEIGLPYCKGQCNADQTQMLFGAAEHIAYAVSGWDFSIRYQSLAALMKVFNETAEANADIDPEQDPTWRKITRIEGRLVALDASSGAQAKWVNDVHTESVGAPLHVITVDGRNVLIYRGPHTEALMTGKLEVGKSYTFIAREASLSQNPDDTLSFDLLSFDLSSAGAKGR